MAIVEVQEEKEKVVTQAKKEVTEVTDVEVDSSTVAMIKELQEKLSRLEAKENNSSSNSTNDLIKMLADKLTDQGGQKVGQFEFNTMHTESDLDPDDVLEEKDYVTFITHKMLYFIADDKRNGKNIKAPFDLIRFKYVSTKQVKQGKETEILQLSSYTCRSKKELEWLRAHSYFGITFHDSMKGVLSRDVEEATRLAKIISRLSSIGQQQLVNMAKERGIAMGDGDLGYLRAMIAQDMSEKDKAVRAEAVRSSVAEQLLEAEIIGKSLT